MNWKLQLTDDSYDVWKIKNLNLSIRVQNNYTNITFLKYFLKLIFLILRKKLNRKLS